MNTTKTFSDSYWRVETDTGAWLIFGDRGRAHKRAFHRKANRIFRVDTTRTWVHSENPDATLSTEYTVTTEERKEKCW